MIGVLNMLLEYSPIITALGTLGAAIASLGAWLCTIATARKLKAEHEQTRQEVGTIHTEINSRMDELLVQKGLASEAAGRAQERSDMRRDASTLD